MTRLRSAQRNAMQCNAMQEAAGHYGESRNIVQAPGTRILIDKQHQIHVKRFFGCRVSRLARTGADY